MRARLTAYVLIVTANVTSLAHAQEAVRELPPQLPSPAHVERWSSILSSWSPSAFADALALGNARAESCHIEGRAWTCMRLDWNIVRDDETWNLRAAKVAFQPDAPVVWSEVRVTANHDSFRAKRASALPGGAFEANSVTWLHSSGILKIDSVNRTETNLELRQLSWATPSGDAHASSASAIDTEQDWSVTGYENLGDFRTSAGSVGGFVAPTLRHLVDGPAELEASYILGDSALAASVLVAPGSHYGVGLTSLARSRVHTREAPPTVEVLVGQDGGFGVTARGTLLLGDDREHVSSAMEGDSSGKTSGLRRWTRRSMYRDALRRTVGAQASGAGHALRLWATSDSGPGTPTEDHGRAILDAAWRHAPNDHIRADVSMRSEVAIGATFEHITDVNVSLSALAGRRGALFIEGAAAPNLSVDVTRYPNGLTASTHGTLAFDVRAGLDATGRWGGTTHRLRPTLRVAVTPLRFGDIERDVDRTDRLTSPFPYSTATSAVSLSQNWTFGDARLSVPAFVWVGLADDPTGDITGGAVVGMKLETGPVVIDAHVFANHDSSSGQLEPSHDARLELAMSTTHHVTLWTNDARRDEIQRLRWERSSPGGMASRSSVAHLAQASSFSPSDERTRLGGAWTLGSGSNALPRVEVSGYVGLDDEVGDGGELEFGASGGASWSRHAEGLGLGIGAGFSRLSGVDVLVAQLGLTWELD